MVRNQNKKTSAVAGIANAQYIQNLSDTIFSESHCNDRTAKREARKVAGRKAMVIAAIVFMAELSFFAAAASAILALASSRLMRFIRLMRGESQCAE